MKAVSEGKGKYSYSGNQILYNKNFVNRQMSKNVGNPNGFAQALSQMSIANSANMRGVPNMGGATFPGLGATRATLPQQYAMQIPQAQVQGSFPQAAVPNISGYQGIPANMITPEQLAALAQNSTPIIGQPQMVNWPQAQTRLPGLQPMGYPMSMPPHQQRPSASSYIIDYTEGLNILDESTGGTAYGMN